MKIWAFYYFTRSKDSSVSFHNSIGIPQGQILFVHNGFTAICFLFVPYLCSIQQIKSITPVLYPYLWLKLRALALMGYLLLVKGNITLSLSQARCNHMTNSGLWGMNAHVVYHFWPQVSHRPSETLLSSFFLSGPLRRLQAPDGEATEWWSYLLPELPGRPLTWNIQLILREWKVTL